MSAWQGTAWGRLSDICHRGAGALSAEAVTSQPTLGWEGPEFTQTCFLPYHSCACHPLGSRESQCHPETGQCPCRPGVEGQACDRCQPGFFGFSVKGCRGEEARSHLGCR